MKEKILKISSESHKKIKQYCKYNCFKLYRWAEQVLLKEATKNDNLQNNKFDK